MLDEERIRQLEDGTTLVKLEASDVTLVIVDDDLHGIILPKRDTYSVKVALFVAVCAQLNTDADFLEEMKGRLFPELD